MICTTLRLDPQQPRMHNLLFLFAYRSETERSLRPDGATRWKETGSLNDFMGAVCHLGTWTLDFTGVRNKFILSH